MKKILTITLVLLSVLVYMISCDDSGKSNSGTSPTVPAATKYKIFITSTTTTGNIGSVENADIICVGDANKPDDGKDYKALLVDGTNRNACGSQNCDNPAETHNVNWVLKANTDYYQEDGTTLIFTTNEYGIVDFGSGDADVFANSITETGYQIWTGLDRYWTPNYTCSSWTTASGTSYGEYGFAAALNYEAIGWGDDSCGNVKRLACVQQ